MPADPAAYGSVPITHKIVVRQEGTAYWAEVEGSELDAFAGPTADLAVLKLARYLDERASILGIHHAFSSYDHYARALRAERRMMTAARDAIDDVVTASEEGAELQRQHADLTRQIAANQTRMLDLGDGGQTDAG